mmetsp:Transcript_48336/g.135035  ORF Transcript_48336/g.135035 Transcript_48336/m.135035 type:complete len:91 (+) Transcript_48336:1519-1791(+)
MCLCGPPPPPALMPMALPDFVCARSAGLIPTCAAWALAGNQAKKMKAVARIHGAATTTDMPGGHAVPIQMHSRAARTQAMLDAAGGGFPT